ncbi:MAG TPA: rod-binding protein [bacterium]|nr:rod-binding protein [bacterium]
MTRPIMGLSSADSPGLDGGADLSARLDLAQSASQAGGVAFDAAAIKAKAGDGVDPQQIAQLRKVSQDFESVFLSYMMKVGRDTTSKGSFWGHTQGEEIFTEMRDDELAKNMAKAGGIGLANLLVEQLTRTLQEQARRQADAGTGA